MESKIVGYGMTKSEKDKEDIDMLFSGLSPQEYKKARRREYYLAHREEELANSRLWRAKNPERYHERNRLYREKNKERLKLQAALYRAARKVDPKTRLVVMEVPK